MSWTLGIDTSSSILGLGIVNNGNPVTSVTRFLKNSQAEHITKSMQFLFKSAEIKTSDITHVAVTAGPGSFTGLRIGISFTKGMFISQETPITGISSLESLAQSHTIKNGSILIGMDARQDKIFTGEFEKTDGVLKRISNDKILPLEEFKTLTEKHNNIICDALGNVKSTVFNFLNDRKGFIKADEVPFQRGLSSAVIGNARIGNSRLWTPATNILPEYMQESYAQKMRKL